MRNKAAVATMVSVALNVALTATKFLQNVYVAAAAWIATLALGTWWIVLHLRQRRAGPREAWHAMELRFQFIEGEVEAIRRTYRLGAVKWDVYPDHPKAH